MTTLWLALHLPLLSLEAFCATLTPEHRSRPVALIADHRVHSANRLAAELGVRAGIKRATALALAADLLLTESHPRRDAAALEAVVHAALAFTPAVSVHDGQTVLLEVQSCLRLFGGLAALHKRVAAAVAPLGHRVQMAAAPTALGAAILAQWNPAQHVLAAHSPRADEQRVVGREGTKKPEAAERPRRPPAGAVRSQGNRPQADERPGVHPKADDANDTATSPHDLVLGAHATQLRALQQLLNEAPVWMLGPGQMHWESLQGMGLRCLSDLRHLPRSGLARRFGAELLDDLDRAFGLQADPRRWLELPPVFSSRLELFARADTTAQVLHGADVLLGRLVAWAQGRHARIAAFTLVMLHERNRQASMAPTELFIELAEPALATAHLQLLLRERLGRCVLAAPTLELQLHCRDIVAGHAPNGELFPTHASETEGLVRLLERLRARLGDAQVQHIVPVADHRPERASQAVPAQGPAPPLPQAALATLAAVAAVEMQAAAQPPLINAPLVQTLQTSQTTQSAAEEQPALLHRPAWLLPAPVPLAERNAVPLLQGRPLHLLSGPERIEAGWWDGDLVARDYFIAQETDDSLVWVFCDRVPGENGEVHWYLQGRFA